MYLSSLSGETVATRADRLWDRSDRKCLACGTVYSPIRRTQKYCPPPKRCRYTNKARILSKNLYVPNLLCKDCGVSFTPRASNQNTCGMKCPGKPEVSKICVYAFCGQKFTVSKNYSVSRQKYCSRECGKKEEVFQRYSISSKLYIKLLDKQGGVCKACGQPPNPEGRMHIDHDHACCPRGGSCGNCIRGLLHLECNVVEGMFKDDPDRLQKVVDHLRSQQGQ